MVYLVYTFYSAYVGFGLYVKHVGKLALTYHLINRIIKT